MNDKEERDRLMGEVSKLAAVETYNNNHAKACSRCSRVDAGSSRGDVTVQRCKLGSILVMDARSAAAAYRHEYWLARHPEQFIEEWQQVRDVLAAGDVDKALTLAHQLVAQKKTDSPLSRDVLADLFPHVVARMTPLRDLVR